MKKLFATICLLAFCVPAQAQYGWCYSHYTAYDEYIWTYAAPQYQTTREAQGVWLESSAVSHSILRVGNQARKFWCGYLPITDVRLVVSSGKLICASDLAYGCNGY